MLVVERAAKRAKAEAPWECTPPSQGILISCVCVCVCTCVKNVHDDRGCDSTVREWSLLWRNLHRSASYTARATPESWCASAHRTAGGAGGFVCLSVSGRPALVLLSSPSQLRCGGRERASFCRLHRKLPVITIVCVEGGLLIV